MNENQELTNKIYQKRHENRLVKLKEQAMTDPLTELWNRRGFLKVAGEILELMKRDGKKASLLFLDIDHFKKYNDDFGHDKGDEILQNLSKILQPDQEENESVPGIRKSDVSGRWGGEEFIVLLPETDLNGARFTAEKLREFIEKNTKITVSIGVASISNNFQQAIKSADKNMYRAKQQGRNRVVVLQQ